MVHHPANVMMRLMGIMILSYLTWVTLASSSVLAWKPASCGVANITTQWTNKVDPANVLPEYPRPQMVRSDNCNNLNGIWQFQAGTSGTEPPPFGKKLSGEILVPFPVESCLSGIGTTQPSMYLWYRLIFDKPASFKLPSTTLHFGAVDWQTTVWLNGAIVGNNTGGYNGFHFDITPHLLARTNELLIRVYDPSDKGAQPNGKQRISAITNPGGDTYTPSSGIWQTVWLENVQRIHIDHVRITTDTRVLTLGVDTVGTIDPVPVTYTVHDGSKVIITGNVASNTIVDIVIPPPVKVWEPGSPFLYGLTLTLNAPGSDSVESYFGLRSFTLQRVHYAGRPDTGVEMGVDRPGDDLPGYPIVLPQADPNLCWALCNNTKECTAWAYGVPSSKCETQPKCWLKNAYAGTVSSECRASGTKAIPAGAVMRPVLNGGFLFLAGWLDQSWWPDGQYTAPTEEALLSDLLAVQTFGFNVVRLHQKVNSQRWYWHADRLGIVILQDMIQKYGGATSATVPLFYNDLQRMIFARGNHPSIVQWTLFNEDDDWTVFDPHEALATIRSFDDTRLIDFDSGGGENPLYLGDVTDVHTYPYPSRTTEPNDHQYAMVGEFGGIGVFIKGKEWVPGKCGTYLHVDTPQEEADTYIKMTQTILNQKHDWSVSIYTQITDVELECDGFLNYDRTNKFTDAQTKQIYDANQALIYGSF